MAIKIGGSKLTSHREHFQKWLNGENPGPMVIEVGATYGCNQKCIHCGFRQYKEYSKKKDFLETKEDFERFLDDFYELGGIEVYFAGNGEPLLNPHLPQWIKYGKQIGLDMSMSTNGMLLNEKKIKEILPYSKWIRFSVNGGNKETYSKVHQCSLNSFEKLVNNLKVAVKYKKDHDLDVKLTIQFVCFEPNWESTKRLVDIHHEIGTDLLIIRGVITKVETQESLKIKQQIGEKLREFEGEDNVEIRWNSFQKEIVQSWDKCYGINFRINMNHLGDLTTCNRNSIKKSVFGNIHKKRFRDIWNSEIKKKLFYEIEEQIGKPQCEHLCQARYDNLFINDFMKQGVK